MEIYRNLIFKRLIYSVWAILGAYSIFYGFLGAQLAFAVVLSGTAVLSPLTLILEKSGKKMPARLLFIMSCNLYIYLTSLGLGHQVAAEYYYLAATMIPIFVFDSHRRWPIFTSIGFSFLCWLLTVTLSTTLIPSEWIAENMPMEIIKNANFIGAMAISLIFLYIFVQTNHHLKGVIELERAKAHHNAKLASLGEMSAGIAHEINNPLAIIAGTVRLLKKHRDNVEKFEAQTETITKAATRIEKIVLGLRKFSRTSEGSIFKTEFLADIVSESLVITGAKTKLHSVLVKTNIQEGLTLSCDSIEIEQVLINLINNGVDAIKEQREKWIQINAFTESNQVVVQVMDSGPGISQEVEEKIFQSFFTTKIVGEGTGLGLSVSKGILDQHKATIKVLRTVKNTCFEIRFPSPTAQNLEVKNAS